MWHLKRHFTDGMHRDAQDFASLGCSVLAALEDDEAFSNCINSPAHSSPPRTLELPVAGVAFFNIETEEVGGWR